MLTSPVGFIRSPGVTIPYPTTGLVAYYPFTNAAGTDLSGTGNNGTVAGAVAATDRNSNPNACIDFDGINDYMQVTKNATLDFTTQLSVMTWFNHDADGYFICDYNPGFDRPWILRITAANKIRAFMADDNLLTNIKIYESTATITPGTWTHAGFTWNSGTLKLYVNGSEDLTVNKIVDDTFTSMSLSSNDVFFARDASNAQIYDGRLDESLIYNRELTSGEVSAIFAV